jgi:uncharacterized protein YqkB
MKGLLQCIGFLASFIFVNAFGTAKFNDTDSNRYIKLQLTQSATSKDETVIIFKNKANPGYDPEEDARYFQGNGHVRLSSFGDNKTQLVFNTQPLPKTSSVTRLNIFTRTDGTYVLKLHEIVNLPPLYNVWLVDNFLNDSLDFRHNPVYTFIVSKSDSNTFGDNRFKIIIKRDVARESRFLSIGVNKMPDSKNLRITWSAENEGDNTVYTVERSDDKEKTFNSVGSVVSDNKGTYSLTDNMPASGINTYRLKQTDFTDSVSYSSIAKIDPSILEVPVIQKSINSATSIYPNPVINTVNVAINDKSTAATYSISITNIWGLKVKEENASGPQWQSEVSNLKPGIYLVRVISKTDNRLVGYNKFTKN